MVCCFNLRFAAATGHGLLKKFAHVPAFLLKEQDKDAPRLRGTEKGMNQVWLFSNRAGQRGSKALASR
jgi:hypothetical protein